MVINRDIKLLSIDLDGTLLTKFKRITKKDMLALYNFSKKGVIIFINTGKSIQSTSKYINQLKFLPTFRYCSCLNGNYIFDVDNKKVIATSTIERDVVKRVFEIVKKYHLKFMYYPVGKHVHEEEHKSSLRILKQRIEHIYEMNNAHANSLKDCHKVNILSYVSKINKKIVDDLNRIEEIDVIETNDRLFEIVPAGVNKGTSLKLIKSIYNLKKENVAAIGDSNNDIAMFKESSINFLVNPKRSHIKKYATHLINKRKNKVSFAIRNYLE